MTNEHEDGDSGPAATLREGLTDLSDSLDTALKALRGLGRAAQRSRDEDLAARRASVAHIFRNVSQAALIIAEGLELESKLHPKINGR